MTRVFLVDDSLLVRKRLKEMLCEIPEVEVVGETGDPAMVSEAVGRLKPHAVVLDIRLPGKSGIELLRELKILRPMMRIIMVSSYPYRSYREQSLAAGADYFFNKTSQFSAIAEAVRSMAREFD